MSDLAIRADKVNLKYRFISHISMKNTVTRVLTGKRAEKRTREVWALKNVSFTVDRGSTVGILGANGAGKTTLLKTIAGVFAPDSGELHTHGLSVSLLALGVGFQSELSGRQNIYINALLHGKGRKEIDAMLDDVIAFSELEEFINHPLKTYSSGMRSRLAFAIACNIKPQILLVDEILGVGDEAFREKSQAKIMELIGENRTALIASHSLDTLVRLCGKVVWLHAGEVQAVGAPEPVIDEYRQFVRHARKQRR
jgi:ABC-type polysaccharide/polyol phosphate transport system ATPase subunit